MEPAGGEYWIVEWICDGERAVMRYDAMLAGRWMACGDDAINHPVSCSDVRPIKRVDLY